MMSTLYFDIKTLIELIQKHPCLWDPSEELYKFKNVRRNSWNEIGRHLFNDYSNMDETAKTLAVDTIKARWSNVRDYFLKNARKGHSNKRKYVYWDKLQFLFKVLPDKHEPAGGECNDNQEISNDSNAYFSNETSTERSLHTRKRHQERFQNQSLYSKKCKTDEDVAFFESIMPAVWKINKDSKYDFRIEMMQLVQKYKHRDEVSLKSAPYHYTNEIYYDSSPSRNSGQSEDTATPSTSKYIDEDGDTPYPLKEERE